MSNTIRTRKAPALIEDTGVTWSIQCRRLAKTAAVALVFSALAACGVSNTEGVGELASFQEMSVPVWNSKADCDTAAAIATKSVVGDNQELNFSCDTVETTKLEKAADWSSANTGEPSSTVNTLAAAPSEAASSPARTHTSSGSSPLMWYMLGNMMSNRNGVTSSGFSPTKDAPTPSAFINSPGNGKMTMSAAQQFSTPTPSQYARLKTNGGVIKTGTIGSNLAQASSYKASTSSISAKSSAHSSVGHSSGGHGGGGGGGG